MKNHKPYVVAGSVVCGLLAVGISISVSNYLGSSAQNSVIVEENNSSLQKTNENFNDVKNRIDIMHERRPNDVYDSKEVAAAVTRTDAWSPLKETPKDMPLSKEELTDGREFIKFDTLKLETLVAGDNLRLAIKETGQQYDVNIDDVESTGDNRITWRGHFEGVDGHNYEVSLTRGPVITVGGIDTPNGQYIVQAYGNKGWVASSALLFKFRVDPVNPKDVVAAEEHR